MTKEIIESLLLKVQSACPEDLELSVKEIPLSGTRVLYLLIVKDDEKFEDIDEWAIHKVYHLFHTLWQIFKDENASGKVRFLFYNQNDFVLYTPVNPSILNQFDGLVYRECYGHEYYVHLLGKVYNIDNLIEYLVKQRKIF